MSMNEIQRSVPLHRILLGAVVPYLLYIFLDRQGMRLTGALAATGWSVAYLLTWFAIKRQWDVFGLIGGVLSVAELVVIAVSGTAEVFLWGTVCYAVVLGVAFLGSVPLSRPLMQLVAEQSAGIDRFPESLRAEPRYTRCWRIVTLAWALAYLAKAALLTGLLLSPLDITVYFTCRFLLGWPMTILLILFSVRFPKYYWRHVAPGVTAPPARPA